MSRELNTLGAKANDAAISQLFFFKQKTAYEIQGDWSSDVCSSICSVDATSANLWPFYVAQKLGYFDAAEIKTDLVFAQSNASVIQQLAAASYDVAPSAGLVDP